MAIANRLPATRTVASFPAAVVPMPESGSVAEMDAMPEASACTRLRFPGVFGVETTAGALDAYRTRWVRLRVKPPVKCPRTVKLSVLPGRRATACGVMVSFSSGQRTVSTASPPGDDVAPVAGSSAEMVAVPGPAASTNAPPGESGRPPTTATVSSLETHSTRCVQSALPPAAKKAVALNAGRSPAIAVSVVGCTRSVTSGTAGGSLGGRVGSPGTTGSEGGGGGGIGGSSGDDGGGAGGVGGSSGGGDGDGDDVARRDGTHSSRSVPGRTCHVPRPVVTARAGPRAASRGSTP